MNAHTNPAARPRFAAEDDIPIPYIQRTRDYYLALGYNNPYRWAHFADVPFTPLGKPLAAARIALITTAAPYQPGIGEQGPGAAYNAAAKFYQAYSAPADTVPDLHISHLYQIENLSPEELARRRQAFDAQKEITRSNRDGS